MLVWKIEEYLQENNCFLNGLNGNNASLGAYMTIIDRINLIKAFDKAKYNVEEWNEFLRYLQGQFYLSPMFRLLYLYLEELLKDKK